jgi:hypothetical protein
MMKTVTYLSLIALLLVPHTGSAEIYFSRGPDGERLVSDRPPPERDQFKVILRRDSVNNMGHALADRPIPTTDPALYSLYIDGASDRFNVDPALIEAVIQVESGFDPNAVSAKGATGLMQLMQQTAWQYDVYDRFNPRDNIYAGVEHLSKLLRRFEGKVPLVLAAYNAGSTAVERHQGIPPYPETMRYVDKVLNYRTFFTQARYNDR